MTRKSSNNNKSHNYKPIINSMRTTCSGVKGVTMTSMPRVDSLCIVLNCIVFCSSNGYFKYLNTETLVLMALLENAT